MKSTFLLKVEFTLEGVEDPILNHLSVYVVVVPYIMCAFML